MARGVLPGRQVLLPRCGRLAWRRPCDSARALIYGADCAVLLGAVPALADVLGGAGLVFIDGHEDATTMEASATGEAANMEVAFLLGLTGRRAPEPLRGHAGVLGPEAIAMLGMRDGLYRREIGVPSIAGQVRLLTVDAVQAG